MRAIIGPGPARGRINAPPSKSCAHRLLIGASLAEGESLLDGAAMSQDILATMDCVRALGAEIRVENGHWWVKGCGGRPLVKDSLPSCAFELTGPSDRNGGCFV